MAKSKSSSKKKSASANNQHLSPVEFLRRKARELPLGKCYLGKDSDENGLCTAIVTRIRPSGNVVACFYVVDTYCFGLTDSFCRVNLGPGEWSEMLKASTDKYKLEETPYEFIHNLIYGAIEFAEEAELEPTNTFDVTEYMLDEDTDSIPIVPVEFGRNGKHYLNVRSYTPESSNIISTLSEVLGDKFEYEVSDPHAPFELRYKPEKASDYPLEPFSYDYPEYPATLDVKHPEIAGAFMDPANLYSLPAEIKELLLSLPANEAAADIAAIILHTIGSTYRDIIENPDEAIPDASLIHSLVFLTALRSDEALDALTELIHQSDDFIEAHLGDLATDLLPQAFYQSSLGHTDRLAALLDVPGIPSFNRFFLFKALALHIKNNPEWRNDGLEIMRAHLRRLAGDLHATRACDAEYVGLIMAVLLDLKAMELLPDIKKIFDTGLVDIDISGDYNSISADFGNAEISVNELRESSIEQLYALLERCRIINDSLV